MTNTFPYRFKRMLAYFGWQHKDISRITGYSHMWIRICATQPKDQHRLEHAVNYFESITNDGTLDIKRGDFIPSPYEVAPKGMKNWDLIAEAIEKNVKK